MGLSLVQDGATGTFFVLAHEPNVIKLINRRRRLKREVVNMLLYSLK